MVKPIMISFVVTLAVCGMLQASEPASWKYDKANSLFASSRYREAIPLYQGLLVSRPDGVSASDLHSKIGDSWFRLGDYANALASYRLALVGQKESQRSETQYWIGFCCFLLGRDAEAAKEFLKIPEQYPGSGMWAGTGYYWAGRAYERMNKLDEAAACYRKAGGSGRTTQGTFALKRAESIQGKKPKGDAPQFR
jgi:tetratricopeptide (TPR) repeat protein